MSWFIDPSINHGYPWNDSFPQNFHTDFIDNGNIRLPYYAWRIKPGVNNGYPWIYYWFKEDTPTGGNMMIGGSQTNYPNGLSGHNNGTLVGGTDTKSMIGGNDVLRGVVETTISNSMSGKIFCIDSDMLAQAIRAINNPSWIQSGARSIIQEMYGANIYDGISMCRMFPFNLTAGQWANVPYIYGVYPLLELEDGLPKPGQYYFWQCTQYAYRFDMGSVTPPISQGWEIENVEFSIYLPYAGTFPVDVRAGELMHVYLDVDVFSGIGEYLLYQNGQLTHSWKVNIGWDLPINLTRGEMLQNFYTTAQNTIAKGIGIAGTVAGIASGNPLAGMAGGAVASSLANNQHYAITAPQVGGLSGMYSYTKVRLIVKIPKMFRDAMGYHEILGANRSTGYLTLNTCSGYVQCNNYKCDIIVATDEEKREIERLMDSGVFI